MIWKMLIIHISIEIYPKNHIFLSSYLHWKFQFKHRKIVELNKVRFLRVQKRDLYYVDVRTNCRPKEYHCQSLTWYLYTFTPTNPCYNYIIVAYIRNILWTNQHFHKDLVRTSTIILFTKNYIWTRKSFLNR